MRYGKLSCIESYCYLHLCLLVHLFSYWTPGGGQMSYEKCLPILLPGRSLGIGSLVFSETQHGIRGSCGVVYDRDGFFDNNIFAPK